jgi:sugar phosphate isomerase/epimerase
MFYPPFTEFGMDTISLNGSFEAKLEAMAEAGFRHVMLSAKDLASHPRGVPGAVAAFRVSGLQATGFQVLRDFEGLSDGLHDYKVDIAKAMLEMCQAVGSSLLLVCSSTSRHATGDAEAVSKDLRKLAMMALPMGIRVAYEALSWGRHVNEFRVSWQMVEMADCPNLGVGVDSFHWFAANTPPDALDLVDPEKIYLVQLSDFMWREVPSFEERMATARTFRVFPGEGAHTAELASLVQGLDAVGFAGPYSFEVFNDDYQQMPLELVVRRARKSAEWLTEQVLVRAGGLPVPK